MSKYFIERYLPDVFDGLEKEHKKQEVIVDKLQKSFFCNLMIQKQSLENQVKKLEEIFSQQTEDLSLLKKEKEQILQTKEELEFGKERLKHQQEVLFLKKEILRLQKELSSISDDNEGVESFSLLSTGEHNDN